MASFEYSSSPSRFRAKGPPTIDQITLHSGAHGNKYFRSQALLFEYIKLQNAKIIDDHVKAHQPLTSSSSSSSNLDASSIINNSMFQSSSSTSSSLFGNDDFHQSDRNNNNRNYYNNRSGGGGGGRMHSGNYHQGSSQKLNDNVPQNIKDPIEDKLLRPFCFHIDPSVAPNSKAQFQIKQENAQQNNNRFLSVSSSSNNITSGMMMMNSSAEQGILAKFNLAGSTQKESLLSSGTRRSRDGESTTQGVNNNNNNNNMNSSPSKNDESENDDTQQVQTRFFLALTRKNFARFARGDLLSQELPQEHQHFFEIIEEASPCVMYFDVEMEPHTALTKEEQEKLISEVKNVEQSVLSSSHHDQSKVSNNTNNSNSSSSTSLTNNLPSSLRKKLKCCPVGCDIEFDETQTRDILISEMKHFLNNEFPLPYPNNQGKVAAIDENSFIVLVSPSKNKFSQHYIIRFKEPEVRFANNSVDAKLVVSCFVEYLYEKAFVDPKVHSALFYHESVERRNCVVSLNQDEIRKASQQNQQERKSSSSSSSLLFSEEFSFSNSPAKIRAMQLRAEKEKQQQQQLMMMDAPPPFSSLSSSSSSLQQDTNNNNNNNTSSFASSSYSIPAISLKCVIDEAVYSRNRMMRCFGSSKLGKLAILDFDHHWHQGGRLNHFQTGNKEATLASTLISEPVITTTDQRLLAAQLFKLIDSDSLLASALARGCKAVQGLQNIASTTVVNNINGSTGLAQITTNRAAFNATDYETTNYNSTAALMKFPVLTKEIIAAQTSAERGGRAAIGNNNNCSIESISFSINNEKDSSMNSDGNYRFLRITLKIRGNRYCHVVKRQHRSNGVYWVVKCSLPTKNYLQSLETQAETASSINVNGMGKCEQRCFDDDCKGKHTLSVELSDSSLCEIRMVAGLGNDRNASKMSEKMVVLNRGGNGNYLSASARRLLEQNETYQQQQQEKQKTKEEIEEEKKRLADALKPKTTKWIPPAKR